MFRNLVTIGKFRISIVSLSIIFCLIVYNILKIREHNLLYTNIEKQMIKEIQPGLDTDIALGKLRPLATIYRRCSIVTDSITHERSVVDVFIYGQNAELILRLMSKVTSDNTQKVIDIGSLESSYRNWFDHCLEIK